MSEEIYKLHLMATFRIIVQGKDARRKFWEYVDKKIKELEPDRQEAIEHGYPDPISIEDAKENGKYFATVSFTMTEDLFTVETLKKEFNDPDYGGITIIVYPNIPMLDFAKVFPKFMENLGLTNWEIDPRMERLDEMKANIDLLLSHRMEKIV